MFNKLAAYIENTGHWDIYMVLLLIVLVSAILIPVFVSLKKDETKN